MNLDKDIKNYKSLDEIADTYELHSNGAFADIYNILHDGVTGEIGYIKSENVGDYFISDVKDKISIDAHFKLKKTITKQGDILVARTGKIGGASIVTEDFINYNTNQNVVNIRIKDSQINPYYLVAFLNTKYGISEFKRASTGNVQPWLNLSILRKIKIPIVSNEYQVLIEEKLKEINDIRLKYENLKKEYENLISNLFNINKIDFESNISILKSNKLESRWDPEFYEKKYCDLLDYIKLVDNRKLSDLVDIEYSIDPGSSCYADEGIPFLRVSNLFEDKITPPEIKINPELIKKPEKYFIKRGNILMSKDGTIGIAYKSEVDLEYIPAGAIVRLSVKSKKIIDEDYLVAVLNSPVVRLQAERDSAGSIIMHWKKSQIENLLIPLVDSELMARISNAVKKCNYLRTIYRNNLIVITKATELSVKNSGEAIEYIMKNYQII